MQTLVTKQFLDTLEYKLTRKLNDLERANKGLGDEVHSLKTTVNQGNLNIQELKNQVFEQNSILEDLTLQVQVLNNFGLPSGGANHKVEVVQYDGDNVVTGSKGMNISVAATNEQFDVLNNRMDKMD